MIHQAFFDLGKFRKQVLSFLVCGAGPGGLEGLSLLTDSIMPYFVSKYGSLQTDENILLGNIVRYDYIGNICTTYNHLLLSTFSNSIHKDKNFKSSEACHLYEK